MEASRPRQPEPGAAAAEKETSVPTSVQNFLVKLGPLRDAVHGDEALRAKLQLGAESEDAFLSRFIIATNGDVNAAVKQIREFVAWYEDLDIERMHRLPAQEVLQSSCDLRYVDERYPLFIRGTDRYGHPVLYAKNGSLNINQIFEHVEEANFIRYHSWLRERMMRMRDVQLAERPDSFSTRPYSPLDAQYTVVMDFEGASMSQLKKPFTSIIKKTMHIDQTFYPERMFRSVLINVPLLFSACWSIVKNFLDKDTLTKLRIVRSDYFKYLEEIIDPAQIPSDFGGKAPKLTYEDHASQVTERFFSSRAANDKRDLTSKTFSDAAAAQDKDTAFTATRTADVSGTGQGSISDAERCAKKEKDGEKDRKSLRDSKVVNIAGPKASNGVNESATAAAAAPVPNPDSVPPAPSVHPATAPTIAASKFDESENDRGHLKDASSQVTDALTVEPRQTTSAVADLQVALLRAYLEFELVERETLEENEYLRRQIAERRSEIEGEQGTNARGLSTPPAPRGAGSFVPSSSSKVLEPLDNEIVALENQIETLRRELEGTLEETSAHQRAISFARAFIENGAHAQEPDHRSLTLEAEKQKLLVERDALLQTLEKAGLPLP